MGLKNICAGNLILLKNNEYSYGINKRDFKSMIGKPLLVEKVVKKVNSQGKKTLEYRVDGGWWIIDKMIEKVITLETDPEYFI
jgi:hypothetical protein